MTAAGDASVELFDRPPDAPDEQPAWPRYVRTPEQRWAYALVLPRKPGTVSPPGPAIVRAHVSVHVGEIGVGVLNADETRFVDEQLVAAGSGPASVDLVILDSGDLGPFVVRNTSPSGASEVDILGIERIRIDVDPGAVRVPGLSEPVPSARWHRYYGSPGVTPSERYRAKRFEALTEPSLERWRDGLALRILPKDQLSRAVYVSGTYEPNTMSVLRTLLSEGDVFFDVGANAGVLTLAASKWVGGTGRVFAFEPSRREFSRLQDNLRLSRVENVTAVPTAIAQAPGRANLRIAAGGYGGLNTLGDRFPYSGVDTWRIESVETISVDAFVEANAIPRVAAIKFDIEGAEAAALRGAERLLRRDRPSLVVEVVARALDANASSVAELENVLKHAAYTFFLIDDRSSALVQVDSLAGVDEQNVVALPRERVTS